VNEIQEQYSTKADEELLLLSLEIDHLQAEAQEVLKAEMSKRGLTVRQAEEERVEREIEQEVETKKKTVSRFSRYRT
jgi:hypothetical protein